MNNLNFDFQFFKINQEIKTINLIQSLQNEFSLISLQKNLQKNDNQSLFLGIIE